MCVCERERERERGREKSFDVFKKRKSLLLLITRIVRKSRATL